MTEQSEGRVAVYIDFDNIVISRFERIHGRGHGAIVNLRDVTAESVRNDANLAQQLAAARVDVGAILDFASSFGAIAIGRAYADWSAEVNAMYKEQLMDRALELVQLFAAVKPAKNGADIRLSVDAVEDMLRLPDLTHVVIVAGDSDYIALAQRCRRLGRYVVGIGVAGSSSAYLKKACDKFVLYEQLPGIVGLPRVAEVDDQASAKTITTSPSGLTKPAPTTAATPTAANSAAAATTPGTAKASKPATASGGAAKAAGSKTSAAKGSTGTANGKHATDLLRQALRLGAGKSDSEWVASSVVKNQMQRLDSSFDESTLGFKNFTEFVKSRNAIVELKEDGLLRYLRFRPTKSTES